MAPSTYKPESIVPLFDYLREEYGWHLRNLLGQGSSAYVFHESWQGRPVAVKISKSPLVFHSIAEKKQLERELQVVLELRGSPHILQLLNYDECMDHLVTVWELADRTLYDELQEMQQLLGSGGLFVNDLLRWMREAAEGIDELNDRGIYHRDIKPQNLFLVRGRVRVGDLGFAKFAGASTISNSVVGTIGYSPLEALRGQMKPTIDVFGLAATYVHLRTARRPFGDDVVTIIERMSHSDFEYAGLTGEEITCLRRALSPDPGKRFPTAGELVRHLERAAPKSHARADSTRLLGWACICQMLRRWAREYPYRGRTAILLIIAGFLCGLAWEPQRYGSPPRGIDGSPVNAGVAAQSRAVITGPKTAEAAARAASSTVARPSRTPLTRIPLGGFPVLPGPSGVRSEPVVIVHILPRVRGVYSPEPLAVADGLAELAVEPQYLSPGFEAAEFHPRGGFVLALSSDGLVTLWNEAGGEPLKILSPGPNQITAVSFSPDGSLFVAGTRDGTLVVCDTETGQTVRRFPGHTDRIRSAFFDHTGDRIVSASDDSTVRIWDVDRGLCQHVLTGHTDAVSFASFSPDGRRVVSASADETARVWDAGTGRTIATLDGHGMVVSCARFLDGGRSVITSAWDGTVRVWNAEEGRVKTVMKVKARLLQSLDVDPSGRRAAVACDNTPLLWDVHANRAKTLAPHEAPIRSVRFDSTGSRLLTSAWDGTIRVWQSDTGKELAVLSGGL